MDFQDSDSPNVVREKISFLKDSISPLAAVLLVADYSHPELEVAIGKVHPVTLRHMEIRFNVLFQLLKNQIKKFNSPFNNTSYINIPNRDVIDNCDFKKVMKILGMSKGTLESLIHNKEISPIKHTRGKKRYFLEEDIIKYAKGLNRI